MKKLFLLAFLAIAFIITGQSSVMAADNDVKTANGSIFSPYWSTDGTSSTYTFIAISNPSISGNVSRAVTVKAILGSGSLAGSASTFTIDLGQTVKLFIVATNHSTVNSTADTTSKFISTTTTGGTHGNLVISATYINETDGGSIYNAKTNFVDILSVWGAIFDPSANAGFAMEFIGDMGDSTGESSEAIYGTTNTWTSEGNL